MFCEILGHVVEESDRVLEDGIVGGWQGLKRATDYKVFDFEVHLETLESLVLSPTLENIPSHTLLVQKAWSSSHWF